jgi:MYXO-CTERM domain-containing protein
MTQLGANTGGQRSLPSRVGRLASTTAVAAMALTAAPAAKADVVEVFHLSGNLTTFLGPLGPLVPFSGTIDLDFTNNFASYTASGAIMVQGRSSVFNQVFLAVSPSLGTITASNSARDTLALWFVAPSSGTWAGFNAGGIFLGDATFGDATGALFGASGNVRRDLSKPAILDPIVDPPPPIVDPPPPTLAVPELSTWAMLLLGLAGLGLAAKRRRALRFLGGKA